MERSPSYSDDLYLMHHGIKGQKWGVRRFQNPDGTLTNAGKSRQKTNGSKKHHYARNAAIGAGLVTAALAISGGLYLHNINEDYGTPSNIIHAPLKDNLEDFGTSRADIKLPKGTKFQRISTEAAEDYKKWGQAYVSRGFHDNMRYRKEMPFVLEEDRPYIHTLKANKEVKAPSRRVAAEIYLGMRPDATHAEYKNFMMFGIRDPESKRQQEFIRRLDEAGYNAVIDENDVGMTKQPLLLIHPDVTTTKVHRMSNIEKVMTTV